MKRMLLSVCLPVSLAAVAQIPNSGFEILTSSGNPSQWSKSFIQQITIDSTGVHGDSIVYDNPDGFLYRKVSDAHSGNYAVEMTNAYNYTQQTGITGGIFLTSADDYGATFPQLVFVQPGQIASFSFYARYFPQGNDQGYALLTVHDENGVQLGQAEVLISGLVDQYTLFSAPVVYTETGTVAAVTVTFATAAAGQQPTPGTRFVVDDVSVSESLGLSENMLQAGVYPNPANGHFYAGAGQPSITDMNGTAVKYSLNADGSIDCSGWASGIYMVSVKGGAQPVRVNVVR